LPLFSSGNGFAGLKAELWTGGGGYDSAIDRNGEPVADAWNGENDRMLLVAHGLAEFGDGGCERAVDDHHGWPDGIEQLFFGDDLAGVEKKLKKDVEGLGFEDDRLTFNAQFTAQFVEFAIGKPPKASSVLFYTNGRAFVVQGVEPSLEFLRIASGHERGSWGRLTFHQVCSGLRHSATT
jgi:hypothetical protein